MSGPAPTGPSASHDDSPHCTLVVMAKAPMPGLAKTRLAPALGADGAAALAARLLQHAVAQALAARLGPVWLSAAPDVQHPAFTALAAQHPALRLCDQGDGDLGARMHRAFVATLREAGPGTLLIGTDAPALDAPKLREAAAALQDHDAVFVPALDGGYALVGLRRPTAALFEGMTWSTAAVMAQTRERLQALGLSHAELAPVADIDEPADLRHLPAGWSLDVATVPTHRASAA